jgi:hypothetical protein
VEIVGFEIGEYAVLNEKVGKDLPLHVGDLVQVLRIIKSNNYDYDVELATGDIDPVRESELNKLTEEQKQLVTYINRGNKVTYSPTGEEVEIIKVDMLHGQVEIKFDDNGVNVVGMESLKPIEEETWRIVEQPEEHLETTQEELLNTFLGHYKNENDTYTVPKELLINMLKLMYE